MASPELRSPKELSGRKRALFNALRDKDERLANMYSGALLVLENRANPECLSLAAHALRELMEKIPEHVDIEIKAMKESLKNKVQEVEDVWDRTVNKSGNKVESSWKGEIDGHLQRLLQKVEDFFIWFKKHHPRRKKEVRDILRKLDGSGRPLPQRLEDLAIDYWSRLRDYFVGVAHHRMQTTHEEFDDWLNALEKFLFDKLKPRTFEDFSEIDELLKK